MAGYLSTGKRHPRSQGASPENETAAVAPLWGRETTQKRNCGGDRKKLVPVRGISRNNGWALAGFLLLLTLPAAGQLTVGDNLNMNLNGTVSGGYNGDFGNLISSDHSLAFGGTGTLSGFYYNPNFLSYTVTPYVNQARDNSSFQSISDASGLNFSSTIFGGSHFPGSISYAKSYNSEGNYAVPGLANYTTHGDGDTFGVSWSELVPGLPSLSANFQMGSNQYSIYGSNDSGSTDSRSFGIRSGYKLAGFNLSAYYQDGTSHGVIPQVLQDSTQSLTSTSSNSGEGLGVGHALPLHGTFSSSFNRSEVNSDFDGYSYNGTIDTYTGTAGFQPANKLHVSVSSDYSDNLTGVLYQSIAAAGGLVQPPNEGQGSHSFDLLGTASYTILTNLLVLSSVDHREQYFLGRNFEANSYAGGITYGRPLFGGNFNTALSLSDNTVSTSSLNTLGFNGTVNYNRRFEKWVAGASFTYAQNVQTLLVTYTTSFYGYSGNLRRRFGRFSWSAGAGVNKTGLTEEKGTTNSSESFNTAISYSHWISLNGSYAKSNGNGIEAGSGLIAAPVPSPLLPSNDLIIYGGKSYGFGLGSTPIRKLTLTASYGKSNSNTDLLGASSWNSTEQINVLFQYQFRKMYWTGGYSMLEQGFSASGSPPDKISAFYVGISRWFNFF
jgi:hypothetical protein